MIPLTKPSLNIVFIGHVDAGKSTICGQILTSLNLVDPRTLQKHKEESKACNRESWYLSYITDTNPEERLKGKTVETGRTTFCTDTKKIVILDAPGHKSYISQMILGAAQADLGILVLSARINEFEAGLKGQTKEHILLAKSMGISKIICLVNKMDDPSVDFSETRFNEIKRKISLFLKKVYREDCLFIPVSGYLGNNILLKDEAQMPWYDGPSFIEFLDRVDIENNPIKAEIIDKKITNEAVGITTGLPTEETLNSRSEAEYKESNIVDDNKELNHKENQLHDKDAFMESSDTKINDQEGFTALTDSLSNLSLSGFEFIVIDKLKTQGATLFYGKLQAGFITKNIPVKILPLSQQTIITGLTDEEDNEITFAQCGDTVKLRLKDFSEETSNYSIFVDTKNNNYVVGNVFTSLITVLEVKSILSIGFKGILHFRNMSINCEIKDIRQKLENGKIIRKKFIKKGESCLVKIQVENDVVFYNGEDVKKNECFAIRDKDITIALGKVRKVTEK